RDGLRVGSNQDDAPASLEGAFHDVVKHGADQYGKSLVCRRRLVIALAHSVDQSPKLSRRVMERDGRRKLRRGGRIEVEHGSRNIFGDELAARLDPQLEQ